LNYTLNYFLGSKIMDIAHCTVNQKNYLAIRFAALDPIELRRKRYSLICPECHESAYYKKASRSGQAACFGARHGENCTLTASKYGQNIVGLGDDQDILENNGNRIILDFNFGTANNSHNDQDAAQNVGGHGGHFTGRGTRTNACMHRRLSTILNNLVTSDQFRQSLQIIEIPGVGAFTAKDFFVQFKDAPSTNIHLYRGYWGKIFIANSDVRFGQGALWLNSGKYYKDISICIPEQSISALYQRFRISDLNELRNRHTLVIGKLITSTKGKRYIQMTDLEYLTIK
jgi:hypothetical protein